MKKYLAKFILTLAGWKVDISVDVDKVRSGVVACAPHTSNWDFFYAILSFWAIEVPIKLFIKDDWTKPWYGFFIKKIGGIGVDRSQRKNMTDFGAGLFNEAERLYLLNTPEGTRSYSEKWRKGFYYIAEKANVPILLGYADYKKKIAGIGKVINTENRSIEEVFDEIQEFYFNIAPKYPELYNKKIH